MVVKNARNEIMTNEGKQKVSRIDLKAVVGDPNGELVVTKSVASRGSVGSTETSLDIVGLSQYSHAVASGRLRHHSK